jgi:ABC-type glycerol-3-phosphate transport system substrate-binding protein
MKEFIKNNKNFFLTVLIFIISAGAYYTYKLNTIDRSTEGKENVVVILRSNEIVKALPQLVKEFNENNNDIFIKLEFSNLDYNNVVLTKLANETNVDIVQYMGKTQVEKEFLQPLDNIGIDYTNVDEGALLKYNNEVIGVKYGSSMPKLMYNDEILTEAGLDPDVKPQTLDELIVMLEVIKEKVPNVVPFNISIANIHDLFSLLGNMAASDDTIYPTFWNYKTGEYNYEALKPVLEKFKYMYNKGLINSDFSEKTDESIFDDFQNEKAAITYTVSYKKYTVVDKTFNMDISFSDIPQLTKVYGKRYYYTSQRILTIANNVKDKESLSDEELKKVKKHEAAVKEVFEWLLSKDITNHLALRDSNYATFELNPFNGGHKTYDSLSYDIGFNQSKFDPTEVLAGNATLLQNAVYSIILEDKDIDSEIDKLKEDINNFIKSNIRNEDLNLEIYKE